MTIIEKKVTECKMGIIDSYNRRKSVDKFIQSQQTAAMDDMFVNIGIRTLIDNIWFSSTGHVPFFDRFGDSIAIGEEKYFVENLIKNSEVKEVAGDAMDYNQLKQHSKDFLMNSVLLVPLKMLYSRMLLAPAKWLMFYDNSINTFVIHFEKLKIPVYSIHEDIIESNMIFVNKELGKWYYKTYPNPKFAKNTETIYVDIKEVDQKKVELTVFSTVKFEIENVKRAKRLKMV